MTYETIKITIAKGQFIPTTEVGGFLAPLNPYCKAMRDVLEEYDLRPIPLEPPSEEDIKVLAALVASSSNEQAASNLGISERELGVRIDMLKEAGYLVGAQNYESLREASSR